MAISAFLKIGDNSNVVYNKSYEIIACNYHFTKQSDFRSNSVISNVCFGVIQLTVNIPPERDLSLYEWYIEKDVHSGVIVFTIPDATSKSTTGDECEKKLYFENAYCFSIKELYDINIHSKRVLQIELVAEKMGANNTSTDIN